MATLHELLVEAVMNMSKVKRLRSLVYAQGPSNLQKEHVAVDFFFFFRKGQPVFNQLSSYSFFLR